MAIISYDSYIAFDEWNNISLYRIVIALLYLLIVLYAPAYIIDKALLRSKWDIVEKIGFYPVISTLILSLIEYFNLLFKMNISYRFLTVILIGIVVLLIYIYHRHSHLSLCVNVNLVEVLGLGIVIGFKIFIFYSVLGEENAFLRGDMFGDAHRVAFLIKYGLGAYLTSPVENYPLFYSFLWSVISKVIPLPYVNTIICIAFFNQVFSILALYILAKVAFRDSRSALLSVVFWTFLSGFSWVILKVDAPATSFSDSGLLDYIEIISRRLGKYSGSIVSPTYMDGHALTRLWSLGLFLISIGALLRAYFGNIDNSNLRGDLIVFASCFIQVFLGHITEAPLLALALFALILIGDKFSSNFIRTLGLATIISSTICLIIAISLYSIYGANRIFFLIPLTPALLFLFGISIKHMYGLMIKHVSTYVVIYSRGFLNKILKKLKIFLSISLVYIYGLMLIAYWIRPKWINWPIATLWYSPAVEWGFLGLLFVFSLTRIGFEERKMHYGLKYIIFLFILQLILLIILNYWNYYHFYVTTPYPFHPILFLPLLALVASQGFIINKLKNKRYKLKKAFIIMFITLIFSFGSLDNVLSSSFWKTNNGWWLKSQLNPSRDDYELINFLYKSSPSSVYDFVLTFYDERKPSSYVVYPSGMAVLSQPLIDILIYTNDSREIYILSRVLPIRYILIPRNESFYINSFLVRAIQNVYPIFSNSKYMLYSLSQLNLSETRLLPSSNDFLTAKIIILEGDLSLMDENDTYVLRDVKGEILPLGEGNVLVKVRLINNNMTLNITATAPTIKIKGNITLVAMKSTWGYFREIRCSAERLIISGESLFKIFNTFENRIYIESFNFDGKYKAYPFPTYLRQDYAKEMIERYWKNNHENPLDVLTSPPGIVWTLIIIVVLLVYKLAPLYMLIAKNRQKPEENCLSWFPEKECS
ncbi:MAG: hypothetical protein QXY55_06320 [Candidatus Korarchaeota archaeon]